jgi:hypothetical protein
MAITKQHPSTVRKLKSIICSKSCGLSIELYIDGTIKWPENVFVTIPKASGNSAAFHSVETPVSIANVGLDSSSSGSHVAASLLSPMTTTRQQQLFLADSNQTASKNTAHYLLSSLFITSVSIPVS